MNKVTCQQTHSANIHIVTLDDIGKVIPNCDGLLTNITNINISINTQIVPITINDTIKSSWCNMLGGVELKKKLLKGN